MSRNEASGLLIIGVLLAASTTVLAEEAKMIIEANPTDFPRIHLIGNIRNAANQPIAGLKVRDFKVKDEGSAAEVISIKEREATKPEPVDIVFVFDTTGSMGGAIKGVRDNIIQFADVLSSTAIDYQLGLVTFGDEIRQVHKPAKDVAAFKKLVGSQHANGGGDEPENSLGAIFEMTKMTFRPGAKVVGILITDASFHTMNEVCSLDPVTLVKELRDLNITLYTLAPPLERYLWMSAETGGVHHEMTKDISTLVNQLAGSIAAQYTIEIETQKRKADETLRTVTLTLNNPQYTGTATATYRAPREVSASSVLRKEGAGDTTSSPDKAFDGNPSTAWATTNPQRGAGEWVRVVFGSSRPLIQIGILGTCSPSPDTFREANRIKSGAFLLSGGKSQPFELKDEPSTQVVSLPAGTRSTFIKVVVNSVYPGASRDVTCIAELDPK